MDYLSSSKHYCSTKYKVIHNLISSGWLSN